MNICKFHQLGLASYQDVWEFQRHLFEENIERKRAGEPTENHLIFVEHPHVYTFGKHAQKNHLLASPDALKALNAQTFEIERGGDITYHGPGQLVAYPIFDLEVLQIGLKRYVALIESCIIEVLNQYGIAAGIIADRIGVWIDINGPKERKIAAIGIKSSRYITMHGLALNVSTDLSMFQHIVPCGIADKGVSSISKELNEKVDFSDVNQRLKESFSRIFVLNYL
jgi:lipoyl(octanoyl) transferase